MGPAPAGRVRLASHVADVTVFGPNPLLSVIIEARGDGADDVHLHAGGQGVWVARTASGAGRGTHALRLYRGRVRLAPSAAARRDALRVPAGGGARPPQRDAW